jgi:hypothetical protein
MGHDVKQAQPEVDLLLVSYNTSAQLGACLRSLETTFAEALYGRVGVRVLDNGSVDDSADMVERRFPRVQLTRQGDNSLYGPGVNTLVRQSSARYVVLLNPDTVVDSDIVTPMVEVLRKDDRVAIVFPRLVGLNGEEQPCCQDFPSLELEAAVLIAGGGLARALRRWWNANQIVLRHFTPSPGQEPFPMRFVWSTCCMMRRQEATALGPFREAFPMYDTDLDLCRRLAESGRTAVYLPQLSVRHVGGASSSPEERAAMMAAGRRRYYQAHGTKRDARLFVLLQTAHRLAFQRRRLNRAAAPRESRS